MKSPAMTACEYGPPAGAAFRAMMARLGMWCLLRVAWELFGQSGGVDERFVQQVAQASAAAGQGLVLGGGERHPRRRVLGPGRWQQSSTDVGGDVDQAYGGRPHLQVGVDDLVVLGAH